jgi:hypothetical protein
MQTPTEAIRACAPELEPLGRTPEEDPLWAALPGAGPVYAARLTAALGTVRDRWTPVEALRCCSGVAPVMERRGTSTWSRWRDCCPTFLRPSFHAAAGESIPHACWARAYDLSPRARGKSHQAAVRALAFKWIRIISTGWHTRPPDSAVRSCESLRTKGSPLLTVAANHPS